MQLMRRLTVAKRMIGCNSIMELSLLAGEKIALHLVLEVRLLEDLFVLYYSGIDEHVAFAKLIRHLANPEHQYLLLKSVSIVATDYSLGVT